MVAGLCSGHVILREALAQSSHLSPVASKKRWGEMGPAGDGDGASPLLPQLESLEMLWVEKSLSQRLEVNGSHQSMDFGARAASVGLGPPARAPLSTFGCHWMSAKTPARLGRRKQHCQPPWRCDPHGSLPKQKCPGWPQHHPALRHPKTLRVKMPVGALGRGAGHSAPPLAGSCALACRQG